MTSALLLWTLMLPAAPTPDATPQSPKGTPPAQSASTDKPAEENDPVVARTIKGDATIAKEPVGARANDRIRRRGEWDSVHRKLERRGASFRRLVQAISRKQGALPGGAAVK